MAPIKGAQECLEDLIRSVRPPGGVAIVLREAKPAKSGDPNWIAATGILSADKMMLYQNAVAELRRQHPTLDWDGITIRDGEWRRVALWSSEVLD